ncbi:ATP-dependent DNA helicase RecG [Prochlorococcus sp. SS52]|uniref:ATP-dependent DNA helicase RecG n=1 Tax=Prochlorococcus sp. SS52 TaxID=1499501 RepID=UPI0002F2BEBA|nr:MULTISPECIES: ATP-dependent DNA helicase RecG [Prochlorococcus]KGG11781.1 ATP-dependent DNA helicase RecG [Prochlorococcus marinus str. LG]KGG18805.1 ATP-dependent DNA helicase RecG [Prochlorococcus marinus str. SS2]KGG23657.1 ATP-dependent DNA helicase RecG [Prochlorococcus marinus str. SS35]KGG32107.1 ATP-dependent DNA helicase RecG [Prochlorococcus marinus str. SS51]KGG35202.1 ATP-dependent DNA helicase RecG [Prochlorococcus sp. SS52]
MEQYKDRKKQNSLELRDQQINALNNWVRLLQKALTVEAENGFKNIHGRAEHFNSFLSREIKEFKSPLLSNEIDKKLTLFAKSFDDYPTSDLPIKRRLIIDARQLLYRLSKEYQIKDIPSPPKLRMSDSQSTANDIRQHLRIDSPLGEVKGVGTKMCECFAALNLFVIKDLLFHYPRDYVDYSSLKRIFSLVPGETTTIIATIRRSNSYTSPRNQNLSILELHLEDMTGRIKISKFFIGRRFSKRSFLKKQESLYPKGTIVAVSGLVKGNSYGKSFNDPLIEVLEHKQALLKSQTIGRILPIYQLTDGLKADRLRQIVHSVIPLALDLEDPLPVNTRESLSLLDKGEAIKQIHRPRNQEYLKKAKRRLVFDEFLFLQLGLLKRRLELGKCKAPSLFINKEREGFTEQFLKLLPFALTNSQQQVLTQIESDIAMSKPMSRLVQGDVGCGKTVVAIAALLRAVESGWQGAFMAPTEVLAQQHYLTLCKWLPQLHVTVELLTGSTAAKERKRIFADLSNGNLKIIVGTHALIEESVSFRRLGLVVVDEQHRFGVNQRNLLLNKGLHPHLLTMTATPIPRTLALSIHGDLDVSQINELPPGRTPIETQLMPSSERYQAYEAIKEQLDIGSQAYVVLPLVDESEKLELRSAIDVYHELSSEILSEYKVGLLHGRMHSSEKKGIINKFVNKEIEVLVSTTVVEVGVDVPEATMMVIDHADRFGLAQLHQLRGRVGRGTKDSKCILIDTAKSLASKNRLEVLVNSHDGFEISEIDLRLRGPGQVLGTRQSGLPDFALANLVNDETILESAREEAEKILKSDPDLIQNKLLKIMLDDYWNRLVTKTQLN